jgi:cyclin A
LAFYHVPREQLELIGVTCLLIACKFEEITPQGVDMLCFLAQNPNVRPEAVYNMELRVLHALDFDVQFPTTFRFYEMFCNLVNASDTHRLFGQFILEIALLEK